MDKQTDRGEGGIGERRPKESEGWMRGQRRRNERSKKISAPFP